jgi:hypothetical protein
LKHAASACAVASQIKPLCGRGQRLGKRRKAFGAAIDWQFTTDNARTKLKRLYPSVHQ